MIILLKNLYDISNIVVILSSWFWIFRGHNCMSISYDFLNLKKTRNFYANVTLLNQPTWAYTIFPRINQKIIPTDTVHWLETITVILSFLKILGLRKITDLNIFFNISENLRKIKVRRSKVVLWKDGPFSLNFDITVATYIGYILVLVHLLRNNCFKLSHDDIKKLE